MKTTRGVSGEAHFTYHESEDAMLSMDKLLDNPTRYLADASSKTLGDSRDLSASETLEEREALEDEEKLTVSEVSRLFDDGHDSEGSIQERDEEVGEAESPPRSLRQQHARSVAKAIPSHHRHTADIGDIVEDFETAAASIPSYNTPQQASSTKELKLSIELPDFVYPRSQYKGPPPPPMKITSEKKVISDFAEQATRNQELDEEEKDFVEYELSDFSIYVPPTVKYRGAELISLNFLGSNGTSTLLCDGIISNGTSQYYVEGVPFDMCSIGNFGEDIHEVGGDIWIQSLLNKSSDVYYKLKEPSLEFSRFHQEFLWLANFCKYFIDYLDSLLSRDELVTLQHFKSGFMEYLTPRHGSEQCFRRWHGKFKFGSDFRTAVNAYVKFLYDQALGTNADFDRHTIWAELLHFTAIPEQPQVEKNTIVTPFVYECFKGMEFGHLLEARAPVAEAATRQVSRGNGLQMPVAAPGSLGSIDSCPSPDSKNTSENCSSKEVRRPFKEKIYPGDVLGVFPDQTKKYWKGQDKLWYVYVTKVRRNSRGRQITLNVIWLYRPSDTICGNAYYPFQKELFFSGHCNCEHDVELDESDVHSKITVAFGAPSESSGYDFFVRSTYLRSLNSFEDDSLFVTFEEIHKRCEHQRPPEPLKYKRGETVLVVVPMPESLSSGAVASQKRLDPCEIVDFKHDPVKRVRLRRLRRRNGIEGEKEKHAPNELVWTGELFEVGVDDIARKCHVRFYSSDQQIPPPYNRNGIGDAFFITMRLEGLELLPIDQDKPHTMIEGFDPSGEPMCEKLPGLDLFCGGGNFGRGLAEGGIINYKWAVDNDKTAMHTYAANSEEGKISLYLGSVNDFLAQAMANNLNNSPCIPQPGEVRFISAGSPCQDFSRMNSKRGNEQGLKNQSLLAAVAAYIDFYRPEYVFLENVVAMAQGEKAPLSQLACCLVGLGYQFQVFKINAWSCGSPQSRSRLIISLAARGCQLSQYPAMTHSPPSGSKDQALGRTADGGKFGLREFGPTAFQFVSAAKATEDLPDIGDGQTRLCMPFPDHVVPKPCLTQTRGKIKLIPRYPRGMNLVKTINAGRNDTRIVDAEAEMASVSTTLITDAEIALLGKKQTRDNKLREAFSKGSTALGRIRPDGVFPPILCVQHPMCSRSGTSFHWDQHRQYTVMEARRAQGFPDHEILTGHRRDQIRIIGNSVPRSLGMVIGLGVPSACLKNGVNKPESDNQPAAVNIHQTLAEDTGPYNARVSNSSKLSRTLVPLNEKQAANISAETEGPKKRKLATSRVEESPTGKGRAHTVKENFDSLAAAIQTDEPVHFVRKKRVNIKPKDFSVVIQPMTSAQSSRYATPVEEATYDELSRTGGKRRRL